MIHPQERTILNHLKTGQKISQRQAANKFEIWRLSDKIFRLRNEGYPIITTMKKSGKNKHYAVYHLEQ